MVGVGVEVKGGCGEGSADGSADAVQVPDRGIDGDPVIERAGGAAISRDETGRGSMRLKGRPETLAVSVTYMPLFKTM